MDIKAFVTELLSVLAGVDFVEDIDIKVEGGPS